MAGFTPISARAWEQEPESSPPVVDAPPSDPVPTFGLADRLTVPVKLNGSGPYPFIVDTGANNSVVSSALVAELGLVRGPPVSLHSIAGVERVDTVQIESITVGHRTQRDLTLSIAPARYMRVGGILGQDWLGSQGLILDFARNQMRLGTQAPRNDDLSIIVPARIRRSGLNLIDARVSGGRTLAFLDTGSTTTVGNFALLDQAVKRGAVARAWRDVELQSVTGQSMIGRLTALRLLSLGKMTLRDVPVVFGPVHTFNYWGLSDQPAILIGNDVLKQFERVTFDFKRGQVHFQLKATSVDRRTSMS